VSAADEAVGLGLKRGELRTMILITGGTGYIGSGLRERQPLFNSPQDRTTPRRRHRSVLGRAGSGPGIDRLEIDEKPGADVRRCVALETMVRKPRYPEVSHRGQSLSRTRRYLGKRGMPFFVSSR
jgi:hypothetical protein